MDDMELKEDNVIMIGECTKFDSTDFLYYNKKYKRGSFKGIAVQHRKTFKNKKDAVKFAEKVYVENGAFADGSIPFEIVFHISRFGYEVASSNLLSNERHFK